MDREKIALRLTEERAKIGFSQADFARKLDISREGLRLYETGQREIGAEFLARAVTLGVDVQYILCGMRSTNLAKVEQAVGAAPLQVINGGVSGVGIAHSGANISVVNTQRHVTRTTVKTVPGETHISDEQKVALQGLVKDVVDAEQKLKQKPKSYQAVWGALNAHCKVSQYALIASADFEKAQKYLNQWMGRLHSMATAPVKDGDTWRKRHYAYIKINSKSPEDAAVVSQYMIKNFKATSLTELSNDQLDKVYRYVAGRRSTKK
ncbi:MAG: putative DNA-binding [Gallionellaceae bacterium]|nr:MAG: putative DNA-binding [Gallionellaceae bacterium]